MTPDLELRDLIGRDLTVPDAETTYRLAGQVEYENGLPQTHVLLVFYDTAQGLVAQATVLADEVSFALSLSPGNYQVWARLHSVVDGIEKVYDLGTLALSGDLDWNAPLHGAITAVAEPLSRQPRTFSLGQNYPNPFNSSTAIQYALGQGQDVHLNIYNLAGQQVAALVDGFQSAGNYRLVWDGTDRQGRALASGVYIYRLKTEAQSQTRKLLLLR